MARELSTEAKTVTMVQALRIRSMIAGSSVLQAALGVDNPEDAEARVYVNFVQDVDVLERPYAIIQMGPTTQTADAGGRNQVYLPSGTLKVTFVDDDKNPSDPGESLVIFYNFFEATWQDVLECSGFNGLPKITLSESEVPKQSAEENSPGETRFWVVNIEASWNLIG